MRVLRWVGALVALGVLGLAAGMGMAQWDIRTLAPELPKPATLLALETEPDAPVSLRLIETARQATALAPPAALSHPSFVLEWADGRILLVDLGMTPEGARAFGAPFERLGGEPVETFGSVAEQLGAATARVAGVVITHLHTDHLEGGRALCAAREGAAVPMFQVPAQATRRNFTTRLSDPILEGEANCLRSTPVAEGRFVPIPGFPGVALIHAAGHTPGSQMLAASVGPAGQRRRWIFTGDVVNDAAAAHEDRPKFLVYRWLIVPESDGQLSRVRRFLSGLARDHGFGLAVAHDAPHLDELALPAFTP